jgi:hypothetical protein
MVGVQSDIYDGQDLTPLAQRGKVTRFLNSTEDVDRLSSMVEDIRDAIMYYQVSPRSSRTHRP